MRFRVDELELSVRTENALDNAGITTISQLVSALAAGRMPKLSKRNLAEIYEALGEVFVERHANPDTGMDAVSNATRALAALTDAERAKIFKVYGVRNLADLAAARPRMAIGAAVGALLAEALGEAIDKADKAASQKPAAPPDNTSEG